MGAAAERSLGETAVPQVWMSDVVRRACGMRLHFVTAVALAIHRRPQNMLAVNEIRDLQQLEPHLRSHGA